MDQTDDIPSLTAAAEQNRRLQQIIAELLHKNEVLRQQLSAGPPASGPMGPPARR